MADSSSGSCSSGSGSHQHRRTRAGTGAQTKSTRLYRYYDVKLISDYLNIFGLLWIAVIRIRIDMYVWFLIYNNIIKYRYQNLQGKLGRKSKSRKFYVKHCCCRSLKFLEICQNRLLEMFKKIYRYRYPPGSGLWVRILMHDNPFSVCRLNGTSFDRA